MIKASKHNLAIREALKDKGMTQWELAIMLGVSEPTITRWFRQELSAERQAKIIEQIKKGGN